MTTILIADDSNVERTLAVGLLAAHVECQVLTATNGGEALALLESRAREIDLVLSDLQMPVMDGLELLSAVRKQYPSLPVVIMTSKGSEETAMQALQAGASGYVPKRRMKQDLVSMVESVLNANRRNRDHARIFEWMAERQFIIDLDNDRAKILPVIGYLQDAAAQFGLCDERNRARLGIALEEALLNGLTHGNLEVGSELRQEGDGSFERLIRERINSDPYRDRRLRITCRLSRESVMFRIRDDGPGFDVSAIPDPTDPENLLKPSGRGLLLMRSFMDYVEYNDTGNEVTMSLFSKRADSTSADEALRCAAAVATV